jgi:hypothetical protein
MLAHPSDGVAQIRAGKDKRIVGARRANQGKGGNRRRLLHVLATAALTALLLPTAATSSAQETRPYRATCVAIPEDPFSPQVRAKGSCQATHLGRDSFVAAHNVVPTGPPDANGDLPIAITGGQATHVAGNGDELHTVYGGTGRISLTTGRIEFDFEGQYTGGTGRFAGASGTSQIWGVVENGVARYREAGTITY